MSLTKKDLNDIQVIVKDTVEFLIEKSEQQTDFKFDKRLEKFEIGFDKKLVKFEDRIVTRINREISDISETTREILAKIDNHENRIVKLETKTAKF